MARFRLLDLETVGLPEAKDWVDPITAPSNYKDPLKIDAYIKEAEAERLERFGLDPDCNRIVALGWHDIGEGSPIVRICKTEDEEKSALGEFWLSYAKCFTKLVTYNGARFDLPVLVMRSIYLQVPYPPIVIAPPWKSPHVDVWDWLSLGGARKDVKSLRFYAKRLGIPIYDDISGKDVAAMVAAGDFEKVANHCLFDLDLLRAIAERVGCLEPQQVGAPF